MRSLLFLVVALMLAGCGAASPATPAEPGSASPPAASTLPSADVTLHTDLVVRQLSPNVLLHVSWKELPEWGRVSSNGLVVMGPHEALLLIALERQKIAWGIVTNKHSRLAEPMIHELLRDRAFTPVTVICGDTTPTPKPHPAPLLLAAQNADIEPEHCWFVGDGESDVRASIAAGMKPVLATYGYVPDLAHARSWGAHHEISQPLDLLALVASAA